MDGTGAGDSVVVPLKAEAKSPSGAAICCFGEPAGVLGSRA